MTGPQSLELNTTIVMNNEDAFTLWTALRDLLVEDAKGKDSGKGGYFPVGDDFKLIRCLEALAIGLDKQRDGLMDKSPLELV